jgi:lauroyl/myristoyl acyltransferase
VGKNNTLEKRKRKYYNIISDCFDSLNVNIDAKDTIKNNWPEYMIDRMLDIVLLTLYEPRKDIFRDMVKFENKNILDRSFVNGRAPLLVSIHLDAFQCSPLTLAFYGYKTSSFMDKNAFDLLNNITKTFISTTGESINMIGLPGRSAIKKAMKDIQNGNLLLMYPEFSLGDKPSLQLELFGNKVYAPIGPAKIAKLLKVPIVPVLLRKKGPLNYLFTVEDPIYFPGENVENEEIIIKIFSWIEKNICSCPEKWWGWSIYKNSMVVSEESTLISS